MKGEGSDRTAPGDGSWYANPPEGHYVWLRHSPRTGPPVRFPKSRYQAACKCGWTSEVTEIARDAQLAALDHKQAASPNVIAAWPEPGEVKSA